MTCSLDHDMQAISANHRCQGGKCQYHMCGLSSVQRQPMGLNVAVDLSLPFPTGVLNHVLEIRMPFTVLHIDRSCHPSAYQEETTCLVPPFFRVCIGNTEFRALLSADSEELPPFGGT